jgi:quercetin dioxygenase-like cupin family protein
MRRMVEGDGASIVLYRIEPGTSFATHVHPFAELGVVLAGEGRFELPDEARVLREGDSFYIPADVPHGFTVPEGTATVVMINVTVPVPSDLPDDSSGAIIRLAEMVVRRTAPSSESP